MALFPEPFNTLLGLQDALQASERAIGCNQARAQAAVIRP
jgi:hypothetical protein